MAGLEALLRWQHPQKGVVSPAEFIPVLENTGMIASVDAWVVHRVCKQLKTSMVASLVSS
ncbi:EAL domain-containing protein [Staphylococcus aureus]|uniref:EAL domain-containing protein n=1 Tax=Staphylococcus aureus TaxID=1280 RepID=UPI003FA77237